MEFIMLIFTSAFLSSGIFLKPSKSDNKKSISGSLVISKSSSCFLLRLSARTAAKSDSESVLGSFLFLDIVQAAELIGAATAASSASVAFSS
jgi:hypothetical protein